MFHGILIGTRLIIILNVIVITAATCSVEWDLETFMRLRREVEKRELCCGISKINAMLERFPTINVKHIIRIAERQQLDEYCMYDYIMNMPIGVHGVPLNPRDLKKNLDSLYEYLKTCCFDPKDAMVKQQLEGLRELHVTLCLDKVFNEQLTKYSKCLYDVVTTTGECLAKEANRTVNNSSDKEICPRLRAIVDCFTFQAVNDCSMAAANLFNKLFKRIVKATVRVDCGACFHVLPDPELATSLDKGKLVTSVLVLSMILFSLILLRWNNSGKTWCT